MTDTHQLASFRLDPADEFPHAAGKEPTYNESFYVNGWDLKQRFGAWMRVGNRVNEGHAELSLCIYLPDGRVACQFQKPRIAANDEFSAGGLTLKVDEPFKTATASYRGEVMLLSDPSLLRDPKRAFAEAPRVAASLDWSITTLGPVHGGEPLRDDQPTMYGRDFSLGHFNQHTKVEGSLIVGDTRLTMDGFGWRDHSWGPRTWQAIHVYRLFVGNFADGSGLMFLKITDRAGLTRRIGVWFDATGGAGGEYEEIEDGDLIVEWTADKDPDTFTLGIRTAKRRMVIDGKVLSLAPLRNRREIDGKMVTSRISESFTQIRVQGRPGTVGLGVTEFIEVLDDDVPVGWPL